MPKSDRTIPGAGVTLRRTQEGDLAALLAMWNDGEVMRWVGFPSGLGFDEARMRRWLERISESPDRHHFCVYHDELGFCGEVYCSLDRERRRGSLDIKFVPRAQGRGLTRDALSTLIDWVFTTFMEIEEVWTEPSEANLAARTLYFSCGMRQVERPADLPDGPSYWSLRRSGLRPCRSSGCGS